MTYDTVYIPSHRRRETLAEKTLPMLLWGGVAPERIVVVVNDEKDFADYAGLAPGIRLVISGAENATGAFNAIHDLVEPGERAVVVEDDIELVCRDVNDKPAPLTGVHRFFEEASEHLPPKGGIWGIAPHANAFYFSGRVTTSLKLVVAHCFGFVGTRDPQLAVSCPSKTDYERTCRYFVRYGSVVRVDYVGVKTKSYTAPGGMQACHTHEERRALERQSVDYITKRWPHLIDEKKKLSSPFAEMRFKRMDAQDPDRLQIIQRQLDKKNGLA